MAKRPNKTKENVSIFRFIGMKTNGNYHIDFKSKEEALQYIDELKDPKLEWYGLYKVNEQRDTLDSITWKRLIPYKNNTPILVKKEEKVSPKKRSRAKKE